MSHAARHSLSVARLIATLCLMAKAPPAPAKKLSLGAADQIKRRYSTIAFGAILAALFNLVAGAGAALLLRHGLPPATVEQSWRYILENTAVWLIGCGLLVPAALAWVYFLSTLRALFDDHLPSQVGVTVAVCLATGGLVPYLAGVGLFVWLPFGPGADNQIYFAQELQSALTWLAVLGEGAYAIAGGLITGFAWRRGKLPRWLLLVSVPVWVACAGFSGATLVYNSEMMAVGFAAALAGFLGWAGAVAVWALLHAKAAVAAAAPPAKKKIAW
jgi:hypothetical protein